MNVAMMILKRVAWIIPVVWGVVTLVFFVARIFGGDPVERFIPPDASDETREAIRHNMGLDQPLLIQYFSYLGGVLRGDLGTTYTTQNSVTADLVTRMPATLELALYALLIGSIVGIVLGVVAAVKRDTWADFLLRGVNVGGMAVPPFAVGLLLIFVFAVTMHVLPGPVGRLPIGMAPPPHVTGLYTWDSLIAGNLPLFWESARHLVLPVTALAIGIMAPMMRVTRNSMVDALESEYIRTAVAMGHTRRTIWFRYALKNTLLPVLTIFGEVLALAIGGALIVEWVFGWPGIGKYALNATIELDFGALQGTVLYASLIYVVVYLFVDILYLLVDPRTRTGAQ